MQGINLCIEYMTSNRYHCIVNLNGGENAKGEIKMNTEKLIVRTSPNDNNIYFNKTMGFEGTKEEAQQFAAKNNFGGGVELLETFRGKIKYSKL